jgi:hypothetical protein
VIPLPLLLLMSGKHSIEEDAQSADEAVLEETKTGETKPAEADAIPHPSEKIPVVRVTYAMVQKVVEGLNALLNEKAQFSAVRKVATLFRILSQRFSAVEEYKIGIASNLGSNIGGKITIPDTKVPEFNKLMNEKLNEVIEIPTNICMTFADLEKFTMTPATLILLEPLLLPS